MGNKEPLTLRSALAIQDEADNIFASTFISEFGHLFYVYYQHALIVDPKDTTKRTLPDFDIVPQEKNHHFIICRYMAEVTNGKNLDHKRKQRRGMAGWLKTHPDEAYNQFPKDVFEDIPHFPLYIYQIFQGALKYPDLQSDVFRYIDNDLYKYTCKALGKFPEPGDQVFKPEPVYKYARTSRFQYPSYGKSMQ